MIKKTSSNQSCGRDSEYITGAFLKSFSNVIVNFPFLDGDVPCSPSYGVYILQLIRFARECSNVDDFNNRNLFLAAKLLKQG